MKKILLLIISLGFSTFSFSENLTRVGVNYVDLEVSETEYYYGFSIDGWGLSIDSAVNDNFLITFDWFTLEDDWGDSADFNIFGAYYAFGNLSEGAFTIGLARSDSDISDESSTDLEIGYSKRSGELDYTFSVVDSDEDATFRAKIMTPVGISFGVLTDGYLDLWSLGYEVKF